MGFTGAFVFCLSDDTIKRVDIPLAPAMYAHLGAGKISEAYQLACLGVTDTEWRDLAEAAVADMKYDVPSSF